MTGDGWVLGGELLENKGEYAMGAVFVFQRNRYWVLLKLIDLLLCSTLSQLGGQLGKGDRIRWNDGWVCA